MKVQGKIKVIGDTQEFGSNGFKKREIVIVTDEQYPQPIQLEFIQDKTALLGQFTVGEVVEIDINLRGREWTNAEGEIKYFNTIQGWRINRVGAAPSAKADEITPEEVGDDLPF